MNTTLSWSTTLQLAVFILVAWLSLFYQLDKLPVQTYDEARNAINTMEMLENGHWLTRHIEGKPDTWETKPPLFVWVQAGCMRMFGYNAFAVRLPSALATLMLAVLLWVWVGKQVHDWAGFMSALILMTSKGFISDHISRTGDHDALLTLFMVGYSILFFHIIQSQKLHLLPWFGILIVCAVLTKSIVGFFALPGLFLYMIWKKRHADIFRSGWFYLTAGFVIVLIAGYYALREYYYPGQLAHIWENELLPRFANSSEVYQYNDYHFLYYAKRIVFGRWQPYVFLSPVCVWFGFKSKLTKPVLIFCLFQLISFFLIISSGTKNFWYDAPLYPFMAVIMGLGFFSVSEIWKKKLPQKLSFAPVLISVCLISLGLCWILFGKDRNQRDYPDEHEQYGYLIAQAESIDDIPSDYILLTDGVYTHALFHKTAWKMRKKGNLEILSVKHDYRKDEVVLSCQPKITSIFTERFQTDTLFQDRGCVFLRVMGRK
ncbi:MAG: ArnT family glycosyltransferase [Bacteroidia bacterium]